MSQFVILDWLRKQHRNPQLGASPASYTYIYICVLETHHSAFEIDFYITAPPDGFMGDAFSRRDAAKARCPG